jgi:hypothetical protein
MEAGVGDTVVIPIRISDTADIARSGTRGFRGRLRLQADILEPIAPTPIGTVDDVNNDRTIILDSIPVNGINGDTVLNLRFLATLAQPDNTELILERLSTNEPSIGGLANVTYINGNFSLIRGSAVLRAGDARAFPGDTVVIPITLETDEQLSLANIDGFRVNVEFNKTLLVPLDEPRGTTETYERIIPLDSLYVEFNGDNVTQRLLTELRFKATLGNAENTFIRLTDAEVLSGYGEVQTIPGEFILDGICKEGDGYRLLVGGEATAFIDIGPNPVRGAELPLRFGVIEPGEVTVRILDALGMPIYINQEVRTPGEYLLSIPTADIPSGSYFVNVQTQTVSLTTNLLILK